MSEHIESPLDRTPLWTLDELRAKVHTTPATVHTFREVSRGRQTAQEARLAVQAQIDVLLNAAKSSEDLMPDDKAGTPASAWASFA